MLRAGTTARHGFVVPFDIVVLDHEARHIRRRVIELQHGDEVLVDLAQPVILVHGDRLVLDDGREVEVIAAEEDLLEVCAADATALMEIAWHLGNRHTRAQIEQDRILVVRDHVLAQMLAGLGATVREISEPFEPARGAYHRHHAHLGDR